ncbi:MAG TPA: hypothetical protein VIJ94_09190 [Caulobacteraceae bacterium]
MSDPFDPDLRRLFAATAEHPADEAFVAAVTVRTSRERWITLIARALVGALVLAVAAAAFGVVMAQGVKVIAPLLNASLAGQATGLVLAIAGLVCLRLLAPLALRRT